MGVLLHHTSVSDVQQIVERLKFSRAEMHHIQALVENLPRFSEVRQMSVSSLKRFFRLDRFGDHLSLARIHALAAAEEPTDYAYAALKRAEWSDKEIWPAASGYRQRSHRDGISAGPVIQGNSDSC